jgi:hypothetical protein
MKIVLPGAAAVFFAGTVAAHAEVLDLTCVATDPGRTGRIRIRIDTENLVVTVGLGLANPESYSKPPSPAPMAR